MTKQIQILDAEQINPEKWNNCLANSSNELIYANYHYLSLLCDNWSGLIVGDYETIFPMPWRKNGELNISMHLRLFNNLVFWQSYKPTSFFNLGIY